MVVLALQPLRQMKVLLYAGDERGILPVGNSRENADWDMIRALPLMEESEFISEEDVIYSSF